VYPIDRQVVLGVRRAGRLGRGAGAPVGNDIVGEPNDCANGSFEITVEEIVRKSILVDTPFI
jgi:hypothetical protein